eukprot:scaffold1411_cov125-Isochrysis_galbana.AAC.7
MQPPDTELHFLDGKASLRASCARPSMSPVRLGPHTKMSLVANQPYLPRGGRSENGIERVRLIPTFSYSCGPQRAHFARVSEVRTGLTV